MGSTNLVKDSPASLISLCERREVALDEVVSGFEAIHSVKYTAARP